MNIKDGRIIIDGFIITESTLHNSITSSALLGIESKDDQHLGHDNKTWLLENDIECDRCYVCANCQTCAGCDNNCYQCTGCVDCQGCTTMCTSCVLCNGYCYGSCDLCVECQGCDGCQNLCQNTCQTNCQLKCNNNVCGGGCQATCANGQCSPCDGSQGCGNTAGSECSPCNNNLGCGNTNGSGEDPCDGSTGCGDMRSCGDMRGGCSEGEGIDPPLPSDIPVILSCYPCDVCQGGGGGAYSCSEWNSNTEICASDYPGPNEVILKKDEADAWMDDYVNKNGDNYEDLSHGSGVYPLLGDGETRERGENGDVILKDKEGNNWTETLNNDGGSTRTRTQEDQNTGAKITTTVTVNSDGKKTSEEKTVINGDGTTETTTTTYNPETGQKEKITYDDGGEITFDGNGNPIKYVDSSGHETPLGPGSSFCQ